MHIKIRNNIQVETTGGLLVEQAWLQYASGPLLREPNLINLGEKIHLHLIIQGWLGEGEAGQEQIRVGAAQRIITDEGQCFLNEADLFAAYGYFPLRAVEKISLSAIVENIDRLVDEFRVDFRIWSKIHPDQAIQGYYSCHL